MIDLNHCYVGDCRRLRYLSVCSGIEAATVAWHPLNWKPVGFSEIEKFPNAVLQHHYPDVPNLGDMTHHERWPRTKIDVLVGGTPCQSFSVAGLRAGMADPRGNLALIYLAIAERLSPEWLVWENVPGVLSSHKGRDFGSIIGAMVELGYGIAYRVLDAQYFGVPQRRRRVFVVGCAGGWRRAAKVLFEPESLLRHSAPSRKEGQETAAGLTAGSNPNSNAAGRRREDDVNLVAKVLRGNSGGIDREDGHTLIADVVPPITSTPYGDHDSRHEHLIPDVANPLTRRMHKGINTTCDERQTPIVAFKPSHYTRGKDGAPSEVTPPLSADADKGDQDSILQHGMTVRRLTPLECERLQGFPDGYTDIPGASDSARYKALGNSMAVPVMRWIGERIASVQTGHA